MGQNFDKNKFAALIKKAMGDRSINQYALHSGISATYISRLLRDMVESPPMPPTIKKLSSKAYNGVTYEDLMVAAGHLTGTEVTGHRSPLLEALERDGDRVILNWFKSLPLDLQSFLKDNNNHTLIQLLNGIKNNGYSNEVIMEWLVTLVNSLEDIAMRYKIDHNKPRGLFVVADNDLTLEEQEDMEKAIEKIKNQGVKPPGIKD